MASSRWSIERVAIEALGPPPRPGVVPPFEQVAAGALQPVDRPGLVIVLAEVLLRLAPQRPPDPLAGMIQLALDPVGEGLVVEPIRLALGEHGEGRVDPRLDRPLAQQVGTEAVDRADVRFLEPLDGAAEVRGLGARRRGRQPRVLQHFAEPQLQLAGGLLGEGHRDDLGNPGAAALDQPHDPPDQLRGLAGTGGGLDDQRLVERFGDEPAILGVGGRHHENFLSASRSGNGGLRRVRCASSRPHTGWKSQNSQALRSPIRPGRAASVPCSIARSTISTTSIPRRRMIGSSVMACVVKPPAAVQYDSRPASTGSPVMASSATA